MATTRPCLAQLSRLCLSPISTSTTSISSRSLSTTSCRQARGANAPPMLSKAAKAGRNIKETSAYKKKVVTVKKKKNLRTTYAVQDPKNLETYSLCEAMRYIRAFEVGRKPDSVKYDLALKYKGQKNGPTIRNRMRLPHPVKTDIRVCVICPSDSQHAKDALAAGAVLAGEEEIFEAVKDGKIEFDRCICQLDSLDKLNKAGLGRYLGPRGLMPSMKLGTVVKDPAGMLRDVLGGIEYRERMGVVRVAVGQLGFTPEQLRNNVKVLMEQVRKDVAQMSDRITKELSEVILSSTNGPGFPLSGEFQSKKADFTPKDLSTIN